MLVLSLTFLYLQFLVQLTQENTYHYFSIHQRLKGEYEYEMRMFLHIFNLEIKVRLSEIRKHEKGA